MIDIDCIQNINAPSDVFSRKWEDILEASHLKEKELFFGLLKAPFLESMEPEWSE